MPKKGKGKGRGDGKRPEDGGARPNPQPQPSGRQGAAARGGRGQHQRPETGRSSEEARRPEDDRTRAEPQLQPQSGRPAQRGGMPPAFSQRGGIPPAFSQRGGQQQSEERGEGAAFYSTSAKHEEPTHRLPRKDSGDRPAYQEKQPTREGISKVMETQEVSSKSSIMSMPVESDEEDQEDVVAKLTGLTIGKESYRPKYTMAPRPGRGKLGRRIALLVNYFALNFKDISIYHYDVDICEVDKSKKVGRSLMDEGMTAKEAIAKKVKHVEHQQRRSIGKKRCREIVSEMLLKPKFRGFSPVYDGQKNMYTCKPFPFQSKDENIVEMTTEGRQKIYCVIMKPVSKEGGTNLISLEPYKEMYSGRSKEIPVDVLMALDTIMAHRNPPLTQVQVRNSYFPFQQPLKTNLGSGLEVWFGYNQSVHFTERGPVVVINLAAKAFHKAGSVIDYACEILDTDITRSAQLQNYQIKMLSDALSKVRVEVTHQPHRRKYYIKGVTKLAAKDIIQEINNRRVSVADYFAQKYHRLKYPHLPCLIMRTTNTTYIPFETCEIFAGQPKVGKLEPNLAANMIRGTAVPPNERFNSILKDARTVTSISQQAMNAFSLFMEIKLMEVNGRVMVSPSLSYEAKEQKPIKPDFRGVWSMDGRKFFRPVTIEKWILISFAQERQVPKGKLEDLAKILARSANKLGMRLGPYETKIFTSRDKTLDVLDFVKNTYRADIAVVVVSRRDLHRYEQVKFFADFELNLVTQCIEEKTVNKIVNARNDQVPNNICLKINLKLGGVNHVLMQRPMVFREPCIVIGADAIHWSRGFGYPSIAALVGSLDPYPSCYTLTCRVQENLDDKKISQEIIRDMKGMVKEVLGAFKMKTTRAPVRIIFFRDGVSDGQFKKALEQEVSSIQKASREVFDLETPIRLTYIIVQKNHQTRFRPQNPRDGAGKMGNIPPGTVVDTDVTHPVFYDYFLCSHEGIQGTSKPPRYTVIHDDNYLNPDELQELTYHLCHMYGRCNRSVSMPAPVFYADLACARAKSYADLYITDDDSSSTSSGFTQKKLPDHVMSAINSMKSFEKNLFYM